MGETKAMSPSAEYFVARLPRSSLPPKYRHTSRTMPSPAISNAVMRLSRPSLRISHSGICEPVSTTGLSSPPSMNDSAEAV